MKVWRGKEKVEIDLPPPAPMMKTKPEPSFVSGIERRTIATTVSPSSGRLTVPPPPAPRHRQKLPVRQARRVVTVPPPPSPVPVTVFYRGTVSSFNLLPEKAEIMMMFCQTANCKVPEPLPELSDFRELPNETPMVFHGLNGVVEEASSVELARRRSIFRFIEQRRERRCKGQNQGQRRDEVGTSCARKKA